MGCATVTRYHVEYEFEGKPANRDVRAGWTSYELIDTADGSNLHLINSFPPDAVIAEVAPEVETGWYQADGDATNPVTFWYAGEISEYGPSLFQGRYCRMQEPQPYEVPWVRQYTDGYYYASNGSQYRRQDNVWSVRPLNYTGPWIVSVFDDSDIESEESGITFVPED